MYILLGLIKYLLGDISIDNFQIIEAPTSLVSILSLMFWGLIWGTTGMIVSVPFTVVIIIILSEIEGTRPLAILLSEKGDISEKE